jgi:transcription antitermination factor NusG
MDCSPIDPSGLAINNSRAWYAIYTRHQHEKTVAEILAYKGFETLLPLYNVRHRWKDRTKLLSLPLFPCYVFLNGGIERRLDLMTTPGIYALVSNAGQPAAIPPAEIDSIRRAVESGSRVEPHPLLKCGEWVRVKRGPLEGIQGILIRKKNLYRLVLSVEMLGRAAAVEVDGNLVERMNGKPAGVRGSGYAAVPEHMGPRNAGGVPTAASTSLQE